MCTRRGRWSRLPTVAALSLLPVFASVLCQATAIVSPKVTFVIALCAPLVASAAGAAMFGTRSLARVVAGIVVGVTIYLSPLLPFVGLWSLWEIEPSPLWSAVEGAANALCTAVGGMALAAWACGGGIVLAELSRVTLGFVERWGWNPRHDKEAHSARPGRQWVEWLVGVRRWVYLGAWLIGAVGSVAALGSVTLDSLPLGGITFGLSVGAWLCSIWTVWFLGKQS